MVYRYAFMVVTDFQYLKSSVK